MHSYLRADALESGTAFVGKYKERIERETDWGGEIVLKLGVPNYYLQYTWGNPGLMLLCRIHFPLQQS